MPFVSVVFPPPSSPESSTSTGAFSVSAKPRPHATVSSAERVITSSATRLHLLKQFPARRGHGSRHFSPQPAPFVALAAPQLRRPPVESSAQPPHPPQIPRANRRNRLPPQ